MWEYLWKVFDITATDLTSVAERREIMTTEIDGLGREGWEMVSFIQNKNVDLEFLFWFKRWKAADDE